MKNLLTLHEAIVIVLISKKSRSASFEEIADFIERRNLFPNRKGGIALAEQVMLRSTKSSGKYLHLFEPLSEKVIRLRNL